MGFVCKQSLTLSGVEYHPGDTIPDGIILNSRVRALKTSGHIVETNDVAGNVAGDGQTGQEAAEVKITIPVIMDAGEVGEVMNVELTESEVQHVFAVMQMTAENASEEIRQIQSEDELIVIHAADSRKSVQKAAKEQASTLSST